MRLFGTALNTPEDVRDWLASTGPGMPPSYDGPADALRYDADDPELSVKGMILAVQGGPPAARSEGIRALRGVGGALADGFVEAVLTGPVPRWWNEKDPLQSGTFGDRFVSMCLLGEATRRCPRALLERAAGTSEETEALFGVFWRDSDGPAADVLLASLASGRTWPASTWCSAAYSVQRSARCAELMAAIQAGHDRTVRDAMVGRVPGLGAYWP